MKRKVVLGQTDYTVLVFVQDEAATDGSGKTGLTNASFTCYYARVETDNDVTVTAISLSALSTITDAHSDGGILQIDATNMPGVYRLDLPDGVFATGAWSAVVMLKDAGDNDAAPVLMEFQLTGVDLDDAQIDANVTQINSVAAAAQRLAESAEQIISASAITGTLSTTEMTTDLTEATDDHYNGRVIIWTSGNLAGQATDITDYDGTTKKLTFTAVTEAPANGDDFIIV